jgi:bromodomain and PHD finger-containing protein 1
MGRKKPLKRRLLNKNDKQEENKSIEIIDNPFQTSLNYLEAQKMVELTFDNQKYYLEMSEEMKIDLINKEEEEENELNKRQNNVVKVPDVNMKEIENDDYPWLLEENKMPTNYVKYMDKTNEELDELIEYDLDEEDIEWLKIINNERIKNELKEIKQQDFIFIMNRLEKESYFQQVDKHQISLNESNDEEEDDAICCICLDGECFNSNVILFCDMCNLAVHQECYGVPYIPEGQWLCRKCIQSPSNAVNCVLCPNQYGVFKQTDNNKWAHMICAIWIPEVHFANTVFLEPIIGIENIESARIKLMCYICRKRNQGACIQCSKTNCYTAFHVTCAQQAGLYMNIQDTGIEINKVAYCDAHTESKSGSKNEDIIKREQIKRIKIAKKVLSERQAPLVMPKLSESVKTVLLEHLSQIEQKQEFLELCINYWLLKRKQRSGVPLIRRLQTPQSIKKQPDLVKNKVNCLEELREQLFYWKKLRQDLERARLLMELIRKRERVKREKIKLNEIIYNYELKPFQIFLLNILDKLKEFDKLKIFYNPVNIKDVPTYYQVIKEPMDFNKIKNNIDSFKYFNFKQFENDFNLIINNCLQFNKQNQFYYKIGLKLREQVS